MKIVEYSFKSCCTCGYQWKCDSQVLISFQLYKMQIYFLIWFGIKMSRSTKLSNVKISYGKIEVLYILKNYGYKMEVVPYRFTCSPLQTSWKPPWTKYGEHLIIFFPIFFLFAIGGFTMKNRVHQNHTTLQLKFKK
jgi:hypothetical protein